MSKRRKRISRRTSSRTTFVLMVFGVIALIIAARLVYLQIMEYENYKSAVMDEITIETEVNPKRGIIYDTGGNILATNRTVYLCFISPQDIIDAMEDAREAAKEDGEKAELYSWTDTDGKGHTGLELDELIASFLSETLDVDYNEVLEKTGKEGRRYEEIKEEIVEEDAQKIREFIDEYHLTSQIYLRQDSIRYYPYGDLASHVIGFTNSDGIGVYGVEAYYNNLLEGESGRYISAQDANSNEMDYKYETFVEAKDGYNIVSTIDSYIQYELQNQLEATLRENKAANRVAGIVMNVKTGFLQRRLMRTFRVKSERRMQESLQSINTNTKIPTLQLILLSLSLSQEHIILRTEKAFTSRHIQISILKYCMLCGKTKR